MGSFIEINDTLRITKHQGFPSELNLDEHLKNPYSLDDIEGKSFSFTGKSNIRIYKVPPVRNFLVEDVSGKWVYWGLCHILEVHHDYEKQETSGKFRIIRLNTPSEMVDMFKFIRYNKPEQDYFKEQV